MFFRTWRDAKKVAKELESYPVYRPPYPGDWDGVSIEEGRANYDYFLENKDKRLSYLRSFLSAFDVPLEFNETSLKAVDAWLHLYGGHLVGDDQYLSSVSLNRFVPEWTNSPEWPQSFAGLNAVWDLGIYTGDFIISINPNCSWMYNDGTWNRGGDDTYAYLKPCIHLQQTRQPFDVFDSTHTTALNKRYVIQRKIRGGMFDLAPDALEQKIKFRASPTVPRPRLEP